MAEDPSLIGSLGAALTLVAGGLIGFASNYFSNHEKGRQDGLAVAHAYKATIKSTSGSLNKVIVDADFLKTYLSSLPPDAVYDFRREDWFSVHHALCANLGSIVSLDPVRGPEAVALISQFFQDFKYTRELFAYSLSLQKAVALKRLEGDDEGAAGIDVHANARQTELGSKMLQLVVLAQEAVDNLETIIHDSRPLSIRQMLGEVGRTIIGKSVTKTSQAALKKGHDKAIDGR